jgi:hypothetical protein
MSFRRVARRTARRTVRRTSRRMDAAAGGPEPNEPTTQSNDEEIEEEDPVDILKTRFAKGEITKEEFEANLKSLQA